MKFNFNKAATLATSTAVTYTAIKAAQKNIDPYTRICIGFSAGLVVSIASDENTTMQYVAFGIMAGSILNGLEITKGGRLTYNNIDSILTPVYVLHETEGIKELLPYEIPNYPIDGFTFKGYNGVFKISNGIYAGITSNAKINYSWGLSGIINKVRNAGYKNKAWCDKQTSRWQQLYNKSI